MSACNKHKHDPKKPNGLDQTNSGPALAVDSLNQRILMYDENLVCRWQCDLKMMALEKNKNASCYPANVSLHKNIWNCRRTKLTPPENADLMLFVCRLGIIELGQNYNGIFWS